MKSPEKLILGLIAVCAMVSMSTEATAQIFGRRIKQSCPGGVCPTDQTHKKTYKQTKTFQTTVTQQIPLSSPAVVSSPVVAPQVVTSTPKPVQSGKLVEDPADSLPLPTDVTEVASAVADGPHCRCLVNGSCGSGTICGADASGAYVVSNAHVWGTQIGKVVTVDLVSEGATKRMQGRIVFSGYSNSRMVDFAIARVVGLTSKKYMPMLKTEPSDAPYGTRGSPKCVWPQVTKPFNDPRNYGQGLITGSPDAIGGQSGSAIYNSKGQQIALLTWSINGRCAGQKTSLLWQVATQRNVMLADERSPDLRELNDSPGRPETEEGVHGDFTDIAAATPSTPTPDLALPARPETEEGIHGDFQVALERADDQAENVVGKSRRPVTENIIASQAGMQELPIWFDGSKPPVDPPSNPDCYKLTPKEWELIQFLRKQSQQQSEVADRDWLALFIKVMPLIMEMIKAISETK